VCRTQLPTIERCCKQNSICAFPLFCIAHVVRPRIDLRSARRSAEEAHYRTSRSSTRGTRGGRIDIRTDISRFVRFARSLKRFGQMFGLLDRLIAGCCRRNCWFKQYAQIDTINQCFEGGTELGFTIERVARNIEDKNSSCLSGVNCFTWCGAVANEFTHWR
jgi:hypothetical protein